jgi:SAM-dependent methyltransferase
VHRELAHGRTAVARRAPYKIPRYRKILGDLFDDVWTRGEPISWLDVGAGYGEVVEALLALAPSGSEIIGVEPMEPKASRAREAGLPIRHAYIGDIEGTFGFASMINVFSHIPDFHQALREVRERLSPGAQLFVETGNAGDLSGAYEVPGELDLPDHLVFAGEGTMTRFLEEGGFTVIEIRRERRDTTTHVLKNLVKRALGRPVALRFPYSSPYRSLLIRAELRGG